MYNGDHYDDNSSLIVRCKFNRSAKSFEQASSDTASKIYLRNELVTSLIEVSPDKILAACQPRHLLLFNKGSCIREYHDSNPHQEFRMKAFIQTLADFDA